MIEAMPDVLIGDRAYDSDDLDDDMRGKGIKMVSPHRKNRKKPKTQDSRELHRYKRRLLNRWELHPQNFLRFVLAAIYPFLECKA